MRNCVVGFYLNMRDNFPNKFLIIHLLAQFQLDNNLPLTPFVTKMARLNSECSDPALQSNCVAGQKWRCIKEDGQWRKHKCKFHVSEMEPKIDV